MTTPTSSGWFEDPQDATQLRYFDGVTWTSTAVSKAPPARPEPSPPATPASEPGYWRAPAETDVARLPDGAILATWWERLLAAMLDGLVVWVISIVVAFPWLAEPTRIMGEYLRAVQAAAEAGTAPPAQAPFQAELATALAPVQLVTVIVLVAYQMIFLRWRAATPGKMVLGTVVRPVDGGSLTLGAILARQLLRVVGFAVSFLPILNLASAILQVLDPAWLLWDPRRQTLHDKIAKTVVVKRAQQTG